MLRGASRSHGAPAHRSGRFHARVIAARLGADGIVTELRGAVGGPYPIGAVSVWVSAADEPIAGELLIADELEAAFEDVPEGWESVEPRRTVLFGWNGRQLVAALALVLLVAAIVAGRSANGGGPEPCSFSSAAGRPCGRGWR